MHYSLKSQREVIPISITAPEGSPKPLKDLNSTPKYKPTLSSY
jgi:hypothetical protein